MMQFTETPQIPLHQQNANNINPCSNILNMNKNHHHHQFHYKPVAQPWSSSSTTTTTTTTSSFLTPKPFVGGGTFGDANCMEQLLVHCANAIESNDATLAQQILWVLNNTAPPDGDSNQRLTCGFLRALIARAARTGSCKMLTTMASSNLVNHTTTSTHKFSVIELASFIDLTPWHRFGFSAANSAILEAIEGFSVVHIVDLSSTHCMQMPTLIDALGNRPEGPPFIKLTVVGRDTTSDTPPMLDVSYEEIGSKLVNFARSRNIVMEFRVVQATSSDGFASLIEQLRVQQLVFAAAAAADRAGGTTEEEALVINCHMMLHHTPEETLGLVNSSAAAAAAAAASSSSHHHYSHFDSSSSVLSPTTKSLRTAFLKAIRSLNPTIVVLVDEDADFTSNDLVCRLRSAFNFLWIPYDAVDTSIRKGSKQLEWYEADICWKIENVIAQEGVQRLERLEPKSRWVQRMRNANFQGISFSEDAILEIKSMLDEHAAGWGLKKEEDDHIVLTWKGHNVVFATIWVPAAPV